MRYSYINTCLKKEVFVLPYDHVVFSAPVKTGSTFRCEMILRVKLFLFVYAQTENSAFSEKQNNQTNRFVPVWPLPSFFFSFLLPTPTAWSRRVQTCATPIRIVETKRRKKEASSSSFSFIFETSATPLPP